MTYDKEFKESALKLSDEIGVKKAAEQLGLPYYTIAEWRKARTRYGANAIVGSGHKRMPTDPNEQRILELERENMELRRANEILQEALGFFANNRKK